MDLRHLTRPNFELNRFGSHLCSGETVPSSDDIVVTFQPCSVINVSVSTVQNFVVRTLWFEKLKKETKLNNVWACLQLARASIETVDACQNDDNWKSPICCGKHSSVGSLLSRRLSLSTDQHKFPHNGSTISSNWYCCEKKEVIK